MQLIIRPDSDSRLYTGMIVSGKVRIGDTVRVAVSGELAKVDRLFVAGEPRPEAGAGDAVAIGLDDHLDVARGDILVEPEHHPTIADQFEARLIWMSEQPLLPGPEYIVKMATRTAVASVTAVKYQLDIDTLSHEAASTLALNEIGVCDFAVAQSGTKSCFASGQTRLHTIVKNALAGC